MHSNKIFNVAIIGAGILGHGIAQRFAEAGYKVALSDICRKKLNQSKNNISSNLSLLKKHGIFKGNIKSTLKLITFNEDLREAVANAQLVIEAAPEELSLKKQILKKIDDCCQPDTIIASNSSSLLPSEYAESTSRQKKVLGMHFFNPPYLLPLVEIIKGPKTSARTVNIVHDLLKYINMVPVVVNKETRGFIGNRLQFALLKEAVKIVEEGVAKPEDIDEVVKYGFGRRLSVLGPFEVFDLGGWDTVSKVQFNITGEKISKLIEDKIRKKHFGVKTGKGFYDWNKNRIKNVKEKLMEALTGIEKLNSGFKFTNRRTK